MIYYVGYYSDKDNVQNRKVFLSATNKMKYIMDTFAKSETSVNILSVAMTKNTHSYPASVEKLSDFVTLVQFKTAGRKNLLTKLIDLYFSKLQLIFYVLLNIKSEDTLLAYHSLAYCKILALMKKIKKFKLILEVEEIYGDVMKSAKATKKELNYFQIANAYIFPTRLLNEKINLSNKPYAIIHGTYQVESDRKCKFDDGKIHCVYAGTFDPRKGGAAAAAAAAAHLDFNYHIHIIGFGSDEDKKSMQELIHKIAKTTECTLTYDGLLSGEDYIRFIQSCDVGLSTQNPNAEFNDTSFPSKVLSYMANGLRVVSIRIKALETSAINDLLYYYDEDTPQAIAQAIKKININDNYDSRERIRKLNIEFVKNLGKLIIND